MGLAIGIGNGILFTSQRGVSSIIPGLIDDLCARATYCENKICTTAILEEIAAVRYTAPVLPIGLLADYPGASAAYSLRNLIDTTTNVVRVRRSYDNAESNFTATEITDGTLVDFTNQGWFQSLTNTFTTFTGNGIGGFDATDDAGFGEAFVNVENGVSGDVVNITLDTSSLTGTWTIVLVDTSGTVARSNSVLLTSGSNSVALTATGDFAFVDIFCQNPTTSISVTNFSASINVGDDGFVAIWYDQSGNSNNAVNPTAVTQYKIVDNGVVYLNNGKPAIYNPNTSGNKFLEWTEFTTVSIIIVNKLLIPARLGDLISRNYGGDSSTDRTIRRSSTTPADGFWRVVNVNTQDWFVPANGDWYSNNVLKTADYTEANTELLFITNTGVQTYSPNRIGDGGTNRAEISAINEVIIYPTDQSANRNGIETNINTEYTIY